MDASRLRGKAPVLFHAQVPRFPLPTRVGREPRAVNKNEKCGLKQDYLAFLSFCPRQVHHHTPNLFVPFGIPSSQQCCGAPLGRLAGSRGLYSGESIDVYSPSKFFVRHLIHSGLSCSFSETPHLRLLLICSVTWTLIT